MSSAATGNTQSGGNPSYDAQQPSLEQADPEMYEIMQREQTRQFKGLELIASENFTSRAVLECLGSVFTNKYSEGLPGKRYYGGNEFIDAMEELCIKRARAAYKLDAEKWMVNVQPYSGSTANFAVYTALLQPHDRVMGLDLPSGGHLTHGYYTAKKKISATSIFFESFPYHVDSKTGYVDYDELERNAKVYRPKMIICGASAYPREWDYKRLRKICDDVGAYLFCDMAHFSGLVATGILSSPFDYADVVTTTTHKSLRGPRAGLIFARKELEERINFAVFPSLQGGPHNATIAAVAVQLREVATPAFASYSRQVVSNSQRLASALMARGYKLATDGTDNHLILWDLRPLKLTGNKFEYLCDEVSITLNKNSIHGDTSALTPGGVRIGTPALTSRGMKEEDFDKVAEFLHRAVQIGVAIQKQLSEEAAAAAASAASSNPDAPAPAAPRKAPIVTLVAFKQAVHSNQEIQALKKDVEKFATTFMMPGFDVTKLKYKE